MRSSQLGIWNSFANSELQPHQNPQSTNRVLAAYGEMVSRRIMEGWTASLMTFMFNQLGGSTTVKLNVMRNEVEQLYSTFLTRAVREPRSSKSVGCLPVLIASADLPVRKGQRSTYEKVTVNDGLHFHGVLLVPSKTRLRVSTEAHFQQNPLLYLRDRKWLDRIDVRAITSDWSFVTDYVLKTVKSKRLTYEEAILILPRTTSELSTRTRSEL